MKKRKTGHTKENSTRWKKPRAHIKVHKKIVRKKKVIRRTHTNKRLTKATRTVVGLAALGMTAKAANNAVNNYK